VELIEIRTFIESDIEKCFDLSRNIDFHKKSMAHSKEKAIAGKTSGLIDLNEQVTWEAVHFGIKQQLTSKITEFEAPNYFVDEMTKGAFKYFRHEHRFIENEGKTLMVDKLYFKSPYGFIGTLANKIVLKRYLTNLLLTRNSYLKTEAESKYTRNK